MNDIDELQKRIDVALQETAGDRARSSFSEYTDTAQDLTRALMQRAREAKGAQAVEQALDEFDRLLQSEDRVRLQYALGQFLSHHPEAARLGLRIPDLEESAPWQVLPSKGATKR